MGKTCRVGFGLVLSDRMSLETPYSARRSVDMTSEA